MSFVSTDIITGCNAVVSGFSTMGSVTLQHTFESDPVFHSAGEGGADRVEANEDFVGVIRAYGHTPPVFPCDASTLSFMLDTTVTGSYVIASTSIRIMGLDIYVPVLDPQNENAIYYEVLFGANGATLSYTGSSVPTDSTTPAIYPTKGLGCLLDDVEQTNVIGMHLSIRNLANRSINSSSNGVYFRPSGNIDWQFRYRRNVKALALLPTNNSIVAVKMMVEAAKQWELSYGRVLGSETKTDHATKEPLWSEITIAKCIKSGAAGSIKDPAGATKWS